MKKFFISVIALSALFPLFAAPKPNAEAKKLLQKFAEKGEKFQPASGRTAFFARGQLKYGLERNDYLHRWVDRPLFQDSSLRDSDTGSFIHDKAWETMHHVTTDLYKIDGFAFFPMTKGREDIYRAAAREGFQLAVLPEMVSPKYKVKVNWKQNFALVERALNSKQSYRINGKLLLTSYPGDSKPEYWQEFKRKMTEKFGDRILIVPMHQLPTNIITGTRTLTAADVNKLADIIRAWLRCVDGYYYNYPPLNEFRRYDDAFDREVMLPLLTGILAEDEFKGKLLAWGTKVGHENFYAKGTFTYNCGGTSMLRGSVGSAVAARADVINLVEWDEQNENTSFRPTLYNSFSTQRIIRALSGIAKGKLFPRQPGDDAEVPNLILSYRKVLVAGETVEFEIVNVPEAESTGKIRNIQLAVKDHHGNNVKTFSGKLADNKLSELRFNLKVADVLDHHLLIPELSVDGKVFANGFTPVELRANWNADNKWVKQPLRDLAKCRAELKIAGITSDGLIKLQGKVSGNVPFHSVEVVEGSDHIYQHNPANLALESENKAVFSIIFGGYAYKNLRLKGEIKVVDASGVNCITQRNGKLSGCITGKSGWQFTGRRTIPGIMNSVFMQLVIDKKNLDKAYLDVDLSGFIPGKVTTPVFKGKIPLADIVKKRVFAANGKVGTHFVVRHTDIQQIMPAPLNSKEAEFTLLVNPALPQSAYFIEVVDKERKTFRSFPVTLFKASGKKATFSSFDFFDKRPIKVECDENMLTVQNLEISPVHGTAVKNSGGNLLSGMLGCNSAFINHFYFAESYSHGNLAVRHMSKSTPDNVKNFPEVVPEKDGYVWKFNGKSNISFPQATIYPYSGFELRLNFNAGNVNTRQTLITNSDQAFTFFINKGRLFASFYAMGKAGRKPVIVPGPKVSAKTLNKCVVRFDQKTAQIECNGVKGRAVPLSGYALYPAETSIGHSINNFGFTGTISHVSIKPL